MSTKNIRRHISDYRLKDGTKIDWFTDYSDEQWLLVQMQIDANARERERQERESLRSFRLALLFLSCLGVLSISFLVGVISSSYVAVQQTQIQKGK